ncbi:protein mesh-like [Argopecten irradians]|uniref:protein mesh-like n=1 Tax=Argopecten irradians TaxID=31199 RepID=UPI0037205346
MRMLPFILIFSLTKLSVSIPLEDFYPYGAAQGDTDFPKNDDGSSPVVTISTLFPFFNNQHYSLYVNTNGAISFLGTLSQFTPEPFPLRNSRRIIAPFWADVDTRHGGTVWYRETTDSSILQRATDEVRLYYPSLNSFRADWVFIATWDNVAFYGSEGSALSKRNTFQAVLITNGGHSFTIFNYYDITWTTGTASGSEPDGLGGTPAQVGFNAGDGINYYAVNESRTAAIINLPRLSNVHVDGKFVFRIDTETIEQGGCNTGGTLTISPRYSHMFGGERKVLAGPCIHATDTVTATFGSSGTPVHCSMDSMYSVACVTPTFYITGDVSVTLNVMTSDQQCDQQLNQSCHHNAVYRGKITIENPLNTKPVLKRVNPSNWIRGEVVTLKWQTEEIPFGMGGSRLEIYSVKPDSDHMPRLRYSKTVVQHLESLQSEASFSLDTDDDVIVLSLVEATDSNRHILRQRVWSDAIVVTPRTILESRMSCTRWQATDDQLASLSDVDVQVCPCSFDQARIDVIRFHPDPVCQQSSTRSNANCLYHPRARQCFRLNTPGPIGAGQLCCYDNNGNLMDMMTSSGGGSLQRFHYFGDAETVVPYLSNIVYDTAPYYHCCMYPHHILSDVSSDCYRFYQRRKPGNCHDYVPNTQAQTYGDPHFVTPDGMAFTFNGVGEFTLFRTITKTFITQVRLQPFIRGGKSGAMVTSFVARAVSVSVTVEIRLNSIRAFDILINGVVQDITGITFLRYTGVTISVLHNVSSNGSHKKEVSLAFCDYGIAFQTLVFDTHLNYVVSFAPSFPSGSIEGLLGNFNNNSNDDLVPLYSHALLANSTTEYIHNNMGLTWRVTEEESLFTYAVGTSHLSIQDHTFVPTFEVPQSAVDDTSRAICGSDRFCYYDYYVTQDITLAISTQVSSVTLSRIQEISRPVVTCGIPPAVEYGQWNTSGMEVGDTGELFCNSGAQLSGARFITCSTGGHWTDIHSACEPSGIRFSLLLFIKVFNSIGNVFVSYMNI